MATVRSILTDAMIEIGAIQSGETLNANDADVGLRWFQRQIDGWAAMNLTLSTQSRTSITWPSNTASQTIAPSGANITAQRPMFIDRLNYVSPGSNPGVEIPIAPQDRDSFSANSIKGLSSALPLAYFYQTDVDAEGGSITLWPVPSQTLTLYLYAPQAVTVPATLDTILLGPAGYQDAFHYDLANRLITPFGIKDPVIVGRVAQSREDYMRVMMRPNNQPGLLGVDAAVVPATGGAYNILIDQSSAYGGT